LAVKVRACPPGRGGDHSTVLLKGYSGVLQTEGFAAFRSLADPKRAGRAGHACILLRPLA
jgi:hypothetical protein